MRQAAFVGKFVAYVAAGYRKGSRLSRIAHTLLVHLTFGKRAPRVPANLDSVEREIVMLGEAGRAGAEAVLQRNARRLEQRFGASSRGFVHARAGRRSTCRNCADSSSGTR